MEETKGMVMSLQAQIDTLEALKAGKFPELPAAADVKTDVLEPIVQVIEVRYCADSLCTCTCKYSIKFRNKSCKILWNHWPHVQSFTSYVRQ